MNRISCFKHVISKDTVAPSQLVEISIGQIGEYSINNTIQGKLQITKRDLHNVAFEYKKDTDLRKVIETAMTNLENIVNSGTYIGWGAPDEGKHSGTAYFVYFKKDLGGNVILGLKFLKGEKVYKPYVLYSEDGFKQRKGKINKGVPTI